MKWNHFILLIKKKTALIGIINKNSKRNREILVQSKNTMKQENIQLLSYLQTASSWSIIIKV